MAGSDPGFNAAEFRDAIHFAMRMSAAPNPTQRLTFRWSTEHTYPIEDRAHKPYNWTEAPATTDTITDLQVDCAFEFLPSSSEVATAIGVFRDVRVKITLLDSEYDAILAHGNGRFPDLVVADDDTYEVKFIPPPQGLFEVAVWTVYAGGSET